MGCRTLHGVAGPDATYTAEYLHWGDHPVRLIPVIRRGWREQFNGDTAAMAAAVLTSGTADDPLWHGHLDEPTEDLEWLYLIHPEHDAVTVYAATMDYRWRLYSRHRLPVSDDDLFRLDGQTIACTGCRTVDEVDFTTTAAMVGSGAVATARCASCGRAEITDALFATTHTPVT